MVTYLVFGAKLSRGIALLGAAVLSLSMMACLGREDGAGLPYPTTMGVLLVVLGASVWLRARDVPGALVLCLPLARAMYGNLREMSGWHYVALSFALLGFATVISLTKGHPRSERKNDPC